MTPFRIRNEVDSAGADFLLFRPRERPEIDGGEIHPISKAASRRNSENRISSIRFEPRWHSQRGNYGALSTVVRSAPPPPFLLFTMYSSHSTCAAGSFFFLTFLFSFTHDSSASYLQTDFADCLLTHAGLSDKKMARMKRRVRKAYEKPEKEEEEEEEEKEGNEADSQKVVKPAQSKKEQNCAVRNATEHCMEIRVLKAGCWRRF